MRNAARGSVLADGTQSIYLADMCGDGLTDLVRIRNGEVCYWPNLGYGRFGAKVTMDNAPWFDNPDQFDQRRVRLADIDGSGTTDIIYLARDGVRLYFNQSGNRWSEARRLAQFPPGRQRLLRHDGRPLGNGTACLVWSSPLPGDARRPLRYIDLMGGTKPHLLIRSVNNLGAETQVHYAPSTKFYLADKRDGRPWMTRLPFPVHVVERVVTYDRISGNRFVTRYAYHHGYFDGIEREFRGFGMVEQWDTEEFAALSAAGALADDDQLGRGVRTYRPCSPGPGFTPACISAAITCPTSSRACSTCNDIGRVLPRAGSDRRAGARASARRHGAARRLDARRRARSLPRPQRLDAAPGSLRSGWHRQGAAPLHRHRTELHDSACCSGEVATATPCSSPMRVNRSATTTSATPPIPASATR